MEKRRVLLGSVLFFSVLLIAQEALAAPLIPNFSVSVGEASNPQDVAASLQILALL